MYKNDNEINELKVLYEISMAIGNSLDINKMLKIFISTLLRKLNANVAIVFQKDKDLNLSNIYSTPKIIFKNKIYNEVYTLAKDFENTNFEYSSNELQDSRFCYFYKLLDIGVFAILKNTPLHIEEPLLAIFLKLSTSIQSCFNHDKLKEHQTMLEVSLERSQSAQKAKDMFLSNMSHEIRTPLNGIIGFLSILEDMDNLNSEQKEYIDIINSSSDLLLNIINDILDYSKISSSKLKLDRVPSNCKKELSSISKLFATKIESKGLNFILDFDENIPDCIMCDKNRFKQILVNLLSNSLKFTQKGEIKFSAKLISKTSDTATIKYSVKDTGIGIPQSKQKIILNSFEQADNSITREFGGTGLGLSIVKGILELTNGELNLNSIVNEGSEFYFTVESKRCNKTLIKEDTDENISFEINRFRSYDYN